MEEAEWLGLGHEFYSLSCGPREQEGCSWVLLETGRQTQSSGLP